jgi:hypothetical protein
MTRLLFLLPALLFCTQVLAETRIDASTDETFNKTLEMMKHELPPQKAARLNAAVMVLPFARMQSVRDTPPDGIVKLDIKKLDGMTADQIIELAKNTVTVKMRIGPPPGLPEQFRKPLAHAGDQPAVRSLSGTEWNVTDNINGHISEQRVTLQSDGKVNDGTSTSGRWEQSGTAVKIALNTDYVVYLGTLDEAVSMKGSAANIEGIDWTWTATRSDSR